MQGNYKDLKDFQSFVYPIVNKIATQSKDENCPLLTNWKLAGQDKVTLEMATYLTILRTLKVKDLNDYCQQLNEIPDFNKQVALTKASNGFTYALNEHKIAQETTEDIMMSADHMVDAIMTSPEQSFKVCYGSDTDLMQCLARCGPLLPHTCKIIRSMLCSQSYYYYRFRIRNDY